MKRAGLILWAAGWGYLLLTGAVAHSLVPPEYLPLVGLVSFLAAWGRAGEGAYLAGAAWPLFFPVYAPRIVEGTLLGGALLQLGIWAGKGIARLRSARYTRRERRETWLYDPEEEPLFTRAGEPLNRAAWRSLTPDEFEEEVLMLFRGQGYAGELTSLSGDEGIDLVLRGEGRYIVAQCKHVYKPVGQPPLRDFAGAMRAAGADVGYFVTTSSFSDPAIHWAESLGDPRIVLVDGPALVRWAREGIMPR
ncbi:MAG: restriction endonuclease [Armatimonadetes bacterium]|nr:restriction endonuclease [Armatimonadota bacterium]